MPADPLASAADEVALVPWPEACQSMTDMTGWGEVTCQTREQFFGRYGDDLKPYSTLTDPDGQYGEPTIYTEWGSKIRDVPWLRDYRYPSEERCAHFMPKAQIGWPMADAAVETPRDERARIANQIRGLIGRGHCKACELRYAAGNRLLCRRCRTSRALADAIEADAVVDHMLRAGGDTNGFSVAGDTDA